LLDIRKFSVKIAFKALSKTRVGVSVLITTHTLKHFYKREGETSCL